MISFTNRIRIDRPVEEVFAYLSDLEHTPEWNWAITETRKISPGPVSVGTRYRQTRSVPRQDTEVLRISALKANQSVEVEGTLAGLPAHVSYELTETATGTELVNTIDLEVRGALRFVSPLLGNRIKRAVADNLNELKTLLQASAAHAARDVPA